MEYAFSACSAVPTLAAHDARACSNVLMAIRASSAASLRTWSYRACDSLSPASTTISSPRILPPVKRGNCDATPTVQLGRNVDAVGNPETGYATAPYCDVSASDGM